MSAQHPEATGPTLSDAYAEACRTLGEEIVGVRLRAKQVDAELARLQTEVQRLTAERDELQRRAAEPGSTA